MDARIAAMTQIRPNPSMRRALCKTKVHWLQEITMPVDIASRRISYLNRGRTPPLAAFWSSPAAADLAIVTVFSVTGLLISLLVLDWLGVG
jgi:hypothetical protein